MESSIPEYRILGENTIIPNDWAHYYQITEYDVIGNGTHAIMTPNHSYGKKNWTWVDGTDLRRGFLEIIPMVDI